LAPLQELFSGSTSENQTTTSLEATISQPDGLQGNAQYTTSTISREDSDYTIHTIVADLLNTKDNLPIIASGEIITSYQNQLLYMMIKAFDFTMGQKNIEIEFINLLAKQLINRWILIDKPETFPIERIDTPQIAEVLHWIQLVYTPSTPTQEQLTASSKLFSFLSEIFSLALTGDTLQLQPELQP
jgi:hypothetical protein